MRIFDSIFGQIVMIISLFFFLLDYKGPVRRETVAAINRRRDTVVRRKSLAPGLQHMSPHSGPPILNAHDNPAFLDDTFDSTFDSVI